MRNRILMTMVIIVIVGIAIQGIIGIIAGIIVASIVGIVYALIKKDKLMKKWSVVVFILSIVCLILFYVCLINSNMLWQSFASMKYNYYL